jgi:hypothetical protein
VHDWPLVGRYDGLWRKWAISQFIWVIVTSPHFSSAKAASGQKYLVCGASQGRCCTRANFVEIQHPRLKAKEAESFGDSDFTRGKAHTCHGRRKAEQGRQI